jgi:hypothetical protein
MKRLEFLASIPSLAALPFLAKEIVQEKSKIILIEPKPIEVVKEIPEDCAMEPEKLSVMLCYDGQVIAEAKNDGRYNRFDARSSRGEIDDMSLGMHYGVIQPRELHLSCRFNEEGVINAFVNSRGFRKS